MGTTAIFLVLLSCVLHAGWNLASKSKNPSAAFFTIAITATVILFSPIFIYFIPYYKDVPPKVWGLLVLTSMFMAFYFINLGNAYRTSEMSLAYPITQSLPVLIVPMVTIILGFGERLSPLALFGMGITAVGCIVLPLASFKADQLKIFFNYSFLFIIGTAIGTVGYSIIDKEALGFLTAGTTNFTPVKAAIFYIVFENLFTLPFLWIYTLLSRRDRITLKKIKKKTLKTSIIAGPVAEITYGIVLLAMQFASNVSYIVAFRQMGIVIGVILGIAVLKEKSTPYKIVGTMLIFCGLVLTKIG